MKHLCLLIFAFAFPTIAFSQNAAQLLFDKGMNYYNLKELYNNSPNLSMYIANRYFLKAGELGKADAYLYCSQLNDLGYYVTSENYSDELKKKADSGDALSSFALAQCYHFGWGINHNGMYAEEYYHKFVRAICKEMETKDLSGEMYVRFMNVILLIYCIEFYEYGDLDENALSDIKSFGKEYDYSPALFEYGLLLLNDKYEKHNNKEGVKAVEEAAYLNNHAAAGLMASIYYGGLYGQEKNEILSKIWVNKFLTGKFK